MLNLFDENSVSDTINDFVAEHPTGALVMFAASAAATTIAAAGGYIYLRNYLNPSKDLDPEVWAVYRQYPEAERVLKRFHHYKDAKTISLLNDFRIAARIAKELRGLSEFPSLIEYYLNHFAKEIKEEGPLYELAPPKKEVPNLPTDMKLMIALKKIRTVQDFFFYDRSFRKDEKLRNALYKHFANSINLNHVKTDPKTTVQEVTTREEFIAKMRDFKNSIKSIKTNIKSLSDLTIGSILRALNGEVTQPISVSFTSFHGYGPNEAEGAISVAFGIKGYKLSGPGKELAFKIMRLTTLTNPLRELITTFDKDTTQNEINEAFITAAELNTLDVINDLIKKYENSITDASFGLAFKKLYERWVENPGKYQKNYAIAISWAKKRYLTETVLLIAKDLEGKDKTLSHELLEETRLSGVHNYLKNRVRG